MRARTRSSAVDTAAIELLLRGPRCLHAVPPLDGASDEQLSTGCNGGGGSGGGDGGDDDERSGNDDEEGKRRRGGCVRVEQADEVSGNAFGLQYAEDLSSCPPGRPADLPPTRLRFRQPTNRGATRADCPAAAAVTNYFLSGGCIQNIECTHTPRRVRARSHVLLSLFRRCRRRRRHRHHHRHRPPVSSSSLSSSAFRLDRCRLPTPSPSPSPPP